MTHQILTKNWKAVACCCGGFQQISSSFRMHGWRPLSSMVWSRYGSAIIKNPVTLRPLQPKPAA
jgi:hypothetical protein